MAVYIWFCPDAIKHWIIFYLKVFLRWRCARPTLKPLTRRSGYVYSWFSSVRPRTPQLFYRWVKLFTCFHVHWTSFTCNHRYESLKSDSTENCFLTRILLLPFLLPHLVFGEVPGVRLDMRSKNVFHHLKSCNTYDYKTLCNYIYRWWTRILFEWRPTQPTSFFYSFHLLDFPTHSNFVSEIPLISKKLRIRRYFIWKYFQSLWISINV